MLVPYAHSSHMASWLPICRSHFSPHIFAKGTHASQAESERGRDSLDHASGSNIKHRDCCNKNHHCKTKAQTLWRYKPLWLRSLSCASPPVCAVVWCYRFFVVSKKNPCLGVHQAKPTWQQFPSCSNETSTSVNVVKTCMAVQSACGSTTFPGPLTASLQFIFANVGAQR